MNSTILLCALIIMVSISDTWSRVPFIPCWLTEPSSCHMFYLKFIIIIIIISEIKAVQKALSNSRWRHIFLRSISMDNALDMLLTMRYTNLRFIIIINVIVIVTDWLAADADWRRFVCDGHVPARCSLRARPLRLSPAVSARVRRGGLCQWRPHLRQRVRDETGSLSTIRRPRRRQSRTLRSRWRHFRFRWR